MIDRVLILIVSGLVKEPPAVVDDPGCSEYEPAPQFVPAIVAAFPLNETHMRLAELFISISPRVLELTEDTVCAVPPVVMVPEQSVASTGPASRRKAAASAAESQFRIRPSPLLRVPAPPWPGSFRPNCRQAGFDRS